MNESTDNLISLDELKEHLNIDKCYLDDDGYLVLLMQTAEVAVEKHARIKIEENNYNRLLAIQAVKILVATWYKNRESSVTGLSVAELPYTFNYLIALIRSHKTTY